MTYRLCLLGMLLLSSALAGANAEDYSRADVMPATLGEPFDIWYGVYLGSVKMGHMNTRLYPLDDNPDVWRMNVAYAFEGVSMGINLSLSGLEQFDFRATPPHSLVTGKSVIDDGRSRREIIIEPRDGEILATITEANATRTVAAPAMDYSLSDELISLNWFKAPRQINDSIELKSYSISELSPSAETFTIRSINSAVVNGVEVTYYETEVNSSSMGNLGVFRFDTNGVMLSGVIGGFMELRKEPEAQARDLDHTVDLYILGTSTIDQPLGNSTSIDRLVLEVNGPQAAKIPASPNQHLQFDADSQVHTLHLGAGQGQPVVATAQDIAANLQESVSYPINESIVTELARTAVGDARTRREKVHALVAFVDTYISDELAPESFSTLDIITHRRGDCTEHSRLFTTLARSLGIPTREVAGLLYMGDDSQAFGGHAWNEVVIDDYWVAVDATFGQTEIDATHIKFSNEKDYITQMALQFGGLRFSVKSIERRIAATTAASSYR